MKDYRNNSLLFSYNQEALGKQNEKYKLGGVKGGHILRKSLQSKEYGSTASQKDTGNIAHFRNRSV